MKSAPSAAGLDTTSPGFKELLETFRQKLEQELESWLAAKATHATSEVREADELTQVLSEYLLRGGKRMRPALLYYAYRACGGRVDEQVIPLSMAVELLHTYLLIHDDIMDRAELRRGEPAAHVVYRSLHSSRGWSGDGGHFGESVAILLGDLAQAYSVELFTSVEAEKSAWNELRRGFSAMCQEVIIGQYLEFTAGFREELGEEELLKVLRMKSGRYSVEWPIHLGAILAGAPPKMRQTLRRYGRVMGEAFQLQDDLLGIFGDAERVGKPVGADLAEGKYTVLIHHTLNRATPEGRDLVLSALGNLEVTTAEVARVRKTIRATGADDKVIRMIETRMDTALATLSDLELEPEGEIFFGGLIDYLRGREA